MNSILFIQKLMNSKPCHNYKYKPASFLCETATSLAGGICSHYYGDKTWDVQRLSVLPTNRRGDRPRGRSYFSARWSHNLDGHMERRDMCTVSLHIQPVSHFILSFSQSMTHFIGPVSRSVSQSVGSSLSSSAFKDKISSLAQRP